MTPNRRLQFDRLLSGRLRAQIAWLIGILLLLWLLSYLLLSASGYQWMQFCADHDVKPFLMPLYLLIDANALNNIYLNTGGQAGHGWMLLVSSLTYLCGLLIFNGIIISILSNYIANRRESYTQGLSRYHLSGHYVIMGYDDMVPSIITHICQADSQAYILLLSAVETIKIRERVRKAIPRELFDRIIFNYGHRNAPDYYPDICLTKAKEIYVVGKRTLPDHDAINVECVENIFTYLGTTTDGTLPTKITCVFEDFDTYYAFKLADIFEKAKTLKVEFVPYNYYVGWAKQVLLARRYCSTYDRHVYTYPSLYREGIGYRDEHFVHLVFVGTSTFAVAFALEAAQLLHFPNGTTYSPIGTTRQPVRTRITFIDKNADTEMQLFRTRNRHFFEVQSCVYRDAETGIQTILPPTLFEGADSDFLDIEFEFIKGDAYSAAVHDEIALWATDTHRYLSIFVAQANQRDNFCLSMNMPDAVYDNDIPIFIRQDNADTFVTELRNTHTVQPTTDGTIDKREKYHVLSENGKVEESRRSQRYANIYPFGMNNTAFYDNRTDICRARLINYLYETADYSSHQFTDRLVLNSLPTLALLQEAGLRWQRLKMSLKWSNLYNAETIACKQASLHIMQKEQPRLSEKQQNECLAQVEHNRWNVEKLLMGYRKPQPMEDKYSIKDNTDSENSKERNKQERDNLYANKKYHFAHADIRPFEQLDSETKNWDIEFTHYLPWITEMGDEDNVINKI